MQPEQVLERGPRGANAARNVNGERAAPSAEPTTRNVLIDTVYAAHVVLNSRMGKFAAAEQRWQQLQGLATQPEDELPSLMARARVELANARAREGPAGP